MVNIDSENGIVDVHTLAEFWDVDVRTIQNYADPAKEDNPLPRISRGKYDFIKAMKWMYNRQRRKIEILETTGDEKLHQLKMRGQLIKNKKDEIALKRELGQLLDKKTTLIAWTNQINVIKNYLNSLKFELLRDLEDLVDKDALYVMKAIIEQSVDAVMEIIANLEIEKYIVNEEKLLEEE